MSVHNRIMTNLAYTKKLYKDTQVFDCLLFSIIVYRCFIRTIDVDSNIVMLSKKL